MASPEQPNFSEIPYICYYCTKGLHSDEELKVHLLKHHESRTISYRIRELHESSGVMLYRSKHFNIGVHCMREGVVVDFKTGQLRKKRKISACDGADVSLPNTQESSEHSLKDVIPKVMSALQDMGRHREFETVLKAISSGKLIDNIALHLLLDIGQLLNAKTPNAIRYTETTKQFWTVLTKVLHGRGVRLLKGKAFDENPENNSLNMNFAVPSEKVVARSSSQFKLDAAQPGIMKQSLTAFASLNNGKEIKLSFDGKRLAMGFGQNLGEEDLGGFEKKPTLLQRQEQLQKELELTQKIDQDKPEHTKDLMIVISCRVKELREFILVRKRKVSALMKQIGPSDDWMASDHASTISYHQTKILQATDLITSMLEHNDDLGLIVSNNKSSNFVKGTGFLNFKEVNHICIRKSPPSNPKPNLENQALEINVKQKSEDWLALRQQAYFTGSTLFNAVFGTLQQQKDHHDAVYKGVKKELSPEMLSRFKHGNDNEKHAVATIIGKVIPIFLPGCVYKEDGCILLPDSKTNRFAVVSGDGTAIKDNDLANAGFEIKCPMPGKEFCPDVHYKLPVYYTTQLLAQMAAKGLDVLFFVSYTKESTTVFKVTFSMDLWKRVLNVANEAIEEKRPTKKPAASQDLFKDLQKFADSAQFVGEFHSLMAVDCDCALNQTDLHNNVYVHKSTHTNALIYKDVNIQTLSDTIKLTLKQVYQLLRRPGKEILVTVASDLDRIKMPMSRDLPHAVPVQYYIGGYSLTMDSARKILHQCIDACDENNLKVRVIAFDGQFLEIATHDGVNPLTIMKLQKSVWEEAKAVPKKKQIEHLMRLHTENKPVYVPAVVHQYEQEALVTEASYEKHDELESMEVENGQDEAVLTGNLCSIEEERDKMELMLIALLCGPRSDKWVNVSVYDLSCKCIDAKSAKTEFTVEELSLMLNVLTTERVVTKSKAQCVNCLMNLLGKRELLEVKKVKSLKSLCMSRLMALPKQVTNALYAANVFLEKLELWESKQVFKNGTQIYTKDCDGTVKQYQIPKWYAYPAQYGSTIYQPIIDPHHLLVNNRCRCCTHGMREMGINSEGWKFVAKNEHKNHTGLTNEHVLELRDRQRNAFAKITFSEAVEKELEKNNFLNEAQWCSILRNFYAAVDEAAIDINTRFEHLMSMRRFLLSHYNPMEFPPPGGYVKGMPIAQFEGFLTNVDRRLQLYKLVKSNAYSQRTVSSLDSETIFGGFQDLDPKGSGHLRADDIPTVLGNSTCLFKYKLDNARAFEMNTTLKPRVYNVDMPVNGKEMQSVEAVDESDYVIVARSHFFDSKERKNNSTKHVKKQKISSFNEISRGGKGVREYHRMNEEKILAHRRSHISDDILQTTLQSYI